MSRNKKQQKLRNHENEKGRVPKNDRDPFNQVCFNFGKHFKYERHMIGKSVDIFVLCMDSHRYVWNIIYKYLWIIHDDP